MVKKEGREDGLGLDLLRKLMKRVYQSGLVISFVTNTHWSLHSLQRRITKILCLRQRAVYSSLSPCFSKKRGLPIPTQSSFLSFELKSDYRSEFFLFCVQRHRFTIRGLLRLHHRRRRHRRLPVGSNAILVFSGSGA